MTSPPPSPRTSRKIRRVIWSTKNKWGGRVSSSKTECAKKARPASSSFFLLPLFLLSCPRPLSLQLSSSTTLIGHWQTSVRVRRRPWQNERYIEWAVFARGKTTPSFHGEKRIPACMRRAWRAHLRTEISMRSRRGLLSTLKLSQGAGADPTRAKEDGLSHLHSRTCTSGWYRCSRLVHEK